MSRVIVTAEWATILDMIGGIVKASWTGVELAMDADMSQTVAMEASFVKARMIWE